MVKNYYSFINEKFGINKIVSDLADLAFNEIKENPEKKTHVITDGTHTINIHLNDMIGGSSFDPMWSTDDYVSGKKKLYIDIGHYNDDIKLHSILIHEINHAIEWHNINKKSNKFIDFKILNDPYKKIKSTIKIIK